MWRLSVAPVILVLVACEDPCHLPGPADACHYVDPMAPGMFPVGVTHATYIDAKREDRSGAPRRLETEIWYPAVAEAWDAPRDAFDLRAEAPADLIEQIEGLVIPLWYQDAARDVPIDHRFAPYPLLVFSHGKNGLRFQTATLMIHLASHGFVVAAMDHKDDTLWDLMREGDLDPAGTIFSMLDRPKDVSFVADQVSRSDGPLGDTVDISRWGVFGHSFGGAVSVAINAEDSEFFYERVDAVLPLAPAVRIVDLVGAGTSVAHSPTLILGGVLDDTVGYENDQVFGYETGRPPKGLVGIRKAGHFSFTELCSMNVIEIAERFDLDATNIISDGCGPDFLPPEDFNRVQNYFAAAFFNRYLRGSARAAEDLDPANLPLAVHNFIEYRQEGLAR